ncbi:MAG TPA: phosphosulfolactate synthase [Bacteroidia bacterium]|jgi:phosphosulfolactate synthase|nr:phosphosulfolactate synthase [Bacteroidia bacterium]
MNFTLPHLPERPSKPRKKGLTMVMDKGLGLRQAENFIEASSDYVDLVKLGFGTSIVTKNLDEKIKLYKDAGFKVYLGGTLFEAFIIRDMFDQYLKLIDKLKLDTAEVSDGSIVMDHDKKCEYIRTLSKHATVLSEVGSKEEGIIIHPNKWTSMMNNELQAGSWKVIAEARESGTVGIYRPNGHAHTLLINKILAKVKQDDILWEAPQKSQQVWFLKLLGANANLGNISFDDVIPLETLRLGLRGDTFFSFLPQSAPKTQ